MYVEVARLCLLDWQQKRRVALGFPPLWQGIAWEPPKGQAVLRGKRPWGTAWPWPYGPPNAIPSYRGGNPSAQTLLLSLSVSFLQWAEFPTMWFLSGDQEIRYILCCSDYLTCPDIGRRKNHDYWHTWLKLNGEGASYFCHFNLKIMHLFWCHDFCYYIFNWPEFHCAQLKLAELN